MNWISVSTRLPKKYGWYLVWQENGKNIGEDFIVFSFDKQWVYPSAGREFLREGITHWLEIIPPTE